ncbi:MAG: hypothetical protein FJ122_01220 [Deltaproteobacteria bacterium]|nr:hypothetical protein [Deltaproteobacteria bacterium]
MGGYGSGKRLRYGTKGTVDASKCVDIRYLKKHGFLLGGHYNLSWTRNGQPSGNADIDIVAGETMTVSCKWRRGSGEDWQPMKCTVNLVHTACTFGGTRQWFICPSCSRRVAVVILFAGSVACRHCLNLTYASCKEGRLDRGFRKREKYKKMMGGADENLYFKPKGMHYQTWQQLRQKYQEAEMGALTVAARSLGIFFSLLFILLSFQNPI